MNNMIKEEKLGGGIDKIRSSVWFRAIWAAVALIPAIAAIALALYYIFGPGEGYFHSDCSDTLYWANAALEGNGIFDDKFKYAALLPFSTVMWMQPLIAVFGVSMTAHNWGMAIFAILFAASIYFCCRSAKFTHAWSSLSVFAVFMVLSCSDKLREMMWGHTIYYSLGLILVFFLLGLAMRFADSIDAERLIPAIVWGVLLAAVSAGSSTNGMQIIVLTTLPVMAAFFAERIFTARDGLISKKSFPAIAVILVVAIGTLVGLKVLSLMKGENITAGYADGYSGWSAVNTWLENSQKFVNHYFSLLGVNMSANAPLFDGESIPYFVRIAVGILILAVPIVMIVYYRRITSRGVKYILWVHVVTCAVIMFGYICGKLSAANWRLTPILGTGILLTICGMREFITDLGLFRIKSEKETREMTEAECLELTDQTSESESVQEKEPSAAKLFSVGISRVSALILAVIIISGIVFAREIRAIPADYGQDNANHMLADFLVEHDLEYGYATFWYAQAITVISDSEVRVRNINAKPSSGVTPYIYQTSLRWYEDQEGVDEYFVLLTSTEYQAVSTSPRWTEWIDKYYVTHYEDIEGFCIYVFSENVLG